MRKRFGVLLTTLALAACALPFGNPTLPTDLARPTTVPSAPTPVIIEDATAPATDDVPTAATIPTSEAAPVDTSLLDDPARIAAAEPEPRDQVQLAEDFKGTGDIPTVARTTPLDVKVGDVEKFWVSNLIDNTNYQVSAQLRYAGPVVLMYVDTSVNVDQADIEKSAQEFEQRIYQRDRTLFGEESSPGIDGDPRLTILNTPLQGAGGYFSSSDGVVKAVNRFSNERDMFIIGINSYPLGTDGYASTLAHEFQHMIEWNVARRSPSWFNEGLSTLAEDLNGYVDQYTALQALAQPDIQLTGWTIDAAQSGDHYGTSQLFFRYFQEHYAGESGLRDLIKADAGDNLEAFVSVAARKRPDIKSFADIYADWSVANLLNDPSIEDGRYTYKLLPGTVTPTELSDDLMNTTVSQFGADYYGDLRGPGLVKFDGSQAVGLTGTQPESGRYMWWSNRGDDSVGTLTHEFDLSNLKQATLQFSTWYELEKDWDYAFVTVSTDGGATWKTLKGSLTTDYDPQGGNLGNGITGVSGSPDAETDAGVRGQWREEKMDLSPYVGQKVLLRFWVINDAAYNAEGMVLDNISIPELNFSDDAEGGDGGWQAQGFVRTTGELPQTWALRLVRTQAGQTTVETVSLDARNHTTIQIDAGEHATLVVMGTTEFTSEPATYTLSIARS